MYLNRIGQRRALALCGALILVGAGQAAAQSTGSVTTKTLEYRVINLSTETHTQILETYDTRILGFLAGAPSALVDVQFQLPFGDAAVQAAVTTTRNLLSAASADPLSFTGPTLTSNSRVLKNSSSASADALQSEELLWVETVELVGEELFALNSNQFGCVAQVNGIQFDCSLDFGKLFVAAGDTVLLTSAGVVENVLRTTTITNTFLNASEYEIVGTSIPQGISEPGMGVLMCLMGLSCWGAARIHRRKVAWE